MEFLSYLVFSYVARIESAVDDEGAKDDHHHDHKHHHHEHDHDHDHKHGKLDQTHFGPA